MASPTVASLCRRLPDALVPVDGFEVPDLEVSAVHVSELTDPTDYLAGGELLLTTGLTLTDSTIACDRYVSRLTAAGLSALGLGLGPSLHEVPQALRDACARHGLCLLVVPPDSAFLTVTKAYWTARSRTSQRELTDALSAHRTLVDAMVSPQPVLATLKALARAVGGWVARLDSAGEVEQVFPAARVRDALNISGQISALRASGVHSSASYPSGDEVVAVFPLPLEDRVVGYLAIGSSEPLNATTRRLVLTAGALLSLDSVHRRRADAAAQAQRQSVATLVDMGYAEPARRLASRVGLSGPEDSVRVAVVESSRSADATEAVLTWMPEALPVPLDEGRSWFILPDTPADPARLRTLLHEVDPRARAITSATVPLASVHQVRIGLLERLRVLSPATVVGPEPAPAGAGSVVEGVRRVVENPRTELVVTLAAYLRHRGQWDAAARDAGVHRNTVRHRMGTIRALLGADPDDPDVAATAWLYLRENGLA